MRVSHHAVERYRERTGRSFAWTQVAEEILGAWIYGSVVLRRREEGEDRPVVYRRAGGLVLVAIGETICTVLLHRPDQFI